MLKRARRLGLNKVEGRRMVRQRPGYDSAAASRATNPRSGFDRRTARGRAATTRTVWGRFSAGLAAREEGRGRLRAAKGSVQQLELPPAVERRTPVDEL